MPKKAPGPKVLRLQLGRELRDLRENAELKREELASRFGWHATKVSRLEQGQATLSPDEIDNLLRELAPEQEVADRVHQLAQEARKRGSYGKVQDWARGYIGMEADADRLRMYESELINGLFQTEDYARAILSTSVVLGAAEIEQVVRNRLARQSLLTQERAPELHLILGEACIRRRVGGKETMLGQIHRLREAATLPNITIQVLPFAEGEHAALGANFTLLDLYEVAATYVYLEDLTSSDFWDKHSHTDVYELVFNRLSIAALSERETIAMFDRVQHELN